MTEDVQKHEQRRSEELHAAHGRLPLGTDPEHIKELERENAHLQLLVAELLIKNQQLRKPD